MSKTVNSFHVMIGFSSKPKMIDSFWLEIHFAHGFWLIFFHYALALSATLQDLSFLR